MGFKTKGACTGCKEILTPGRGEAHLLKCKETLQLLQSGEKLEEGYIIRISWVEEPNVYWMFVAVPKTLALIDLDDFLREIWLECCGHMSEFTILGKEYVSHTYSGSPSKVMKKHLGEIVFEGLEFEYTYDMGSSTYLLLKVLEAIDATPSHQVTLLMRNDPPPFVCEKCKKPAEIICIVCGATICKKCQKKHPCVEEGEATYMLMPLVNSPRTGVCGYGDEEL
ncbi:MAG: hypothetical protein QRY71_00355 [Candidatus Rhabdochlamydia sp.]